MYSVSLRPTADSTQVHAGGQAQEGQNTRKVGYVVHVVTFPLVGDWTTQRLLFGVCRGVQ